MDRKIEVLARVTFMLDGGALCSTVCYALHKNTRCGLDGISNGLIFKTYDRGLMGIMTTDMVLAVLH